MAIFCQFHNLPRSLTLLHELARKNEWIRLLYEAYSQSCPLDTLKDIIEKYLQKGPLQKHLLNMINSLNSVFSSEFSEQKIKSFSNLIKINNIEDSDIIEKSHKFLVIEIFRRLKVKEYDNETIKNTIKTIGSF